MQAITTDPQTNQTLFFGRSLRFWIIFSALFVLVFIIAVTFFTNALVQLSYSFADQARKGEVKLQILHANGQQSTITPIGNWVLIPRDSRAIIAQTDNSETIKHIQELPLIGIPDYHLTLQPQKQVSKLGAEALGCNLTNEQGLFTHNCSSISNINQIVRPDTGQWETLPVETGREEIIFSRYKQGFLAIEGNALDYIIPGQNTAFYPLPTDFKQDTDTIDIITDTDSDNSAFVVANHTKGTYLLVEDFTTTARQQTLTRKANTDPQFNLSICSMNQAQLSCYFGPDTHDHENTDETTAYRAAHQKGTIEIIPFQNTSDSKLLAVENLPSIDQIYQTTYGLYALSDEQLYQIQQNGDTAQGSLLTPNVQTAASTKDAIFYTTNDDKLFEYNTTEQTAYLRFHSSHLTALTLSTYGGTVLLNAFINADASSDLRATAHVYQLHETLLPETAVRKEDKLPYSDNSLPISYMDYSDKIIYINSEQVFNTDPQSGTRVVDDAATINLRDRILQRLKSDNLLTGAQVRFVN